MKKFLLYTIGLLLADQSIAYGCQYQDLGQYQWQHRLVLGKLASAQQLQTLTEQIQHTSQEIKARKLVFLLLYQDSLYLHASEQVPCTELQKDVQNRLKQADFVLIGLDGGSKVSYSHQTFSLEEVFNRIDLMPIRRAELSAHKN